MASLKLGSKAESFQLHGQEWICMTELSSDVVVEVGEFSFHLHKFPLINRSGTLQKLINSQDSNSNSNQQCIIRLHDIPGGSKAFETISKFFYDIKMELTAQNIVSVHCAAHYLHMTDDFGEGNLMTQTEYFLREVFTSWHDSIRALQTCEDDALFHAEELHIVSRCIDSLASKTCADPSIFGWPLMEHYSGKNLEASVLWSGISPVPAKSPGRDWLYRDISVLKLPMYKRLILALKSKGAKPDDIAGSLMHYAKKYLPGLNKRGVHKESSSGPGLSETDQKSLLEELVSLLPLEKGANKTNFLLGLLHTTIILKASNSCKENLEKLVGNQLEDAHLDDLLIPNASYTAESLYNVDCIQRVLDHFMMQHQSGLATSPEIAEELQMVESSNKEMEAIASVGRLVDGYLAEIADDTTLKCAKFQAIAASLPDYARPLDDGIYHAIDVFLKSHGSMTDSEREQLCRLMNCQKLSLDACTHAAQNERLPLRVVVQVLFFEQLRLRTTIAGWLFVSDNMDQNPPRVLPRSPKREGNGEKTGDLRMDELRLRVIELERECSSMRHDLIKIGKSKGGSRPWSYLSKKLGFAGTKALVQADDKEGSALDC
ncbi:hypothetical protein LUZ60_006836 [Juncus effusus]|nr:hypothetical protein LUZ60_006836 [Juncus effusus]